MKQENIQIIYLILISIIIVVLIFLCVYLVKNVNLMKTEPFKFAITKYEMDSCSCMKDGYFFNFNKSGEQESEKNWATGNFNIT